MYEGVFFCSKYFFCKLIYDKMSYYEVVKFVYVERCEVIIKWFIFFKCVFIKSILVLYCIR